MRTAILNIEPDTASDVYAKPGSITHIQPVALTDWIRPRM